MAARGHRESFSLLIILFCRLLIRPLTRALQSAALHCKQLSTAFIIHSDERLHRKDLTSHHKAALSVCGGFSTRFKRALQAVC